MVLKPLVEKLADSTPVRRVSRPLPAFGRVLLPETVAVAVPPRPSDTV